MTFKSYLIFPLLNRAPARPPIIPIMMKKPKITHVRYMYIELLVFYFKF